MVSERKFAIVNGVKTTHKAIAVCDLISYDVWGNAKDGYEVNDAHAFSRDHEIIGECEISNLPLHPGAKDDYRSFPNSGSFSAEVCVSFSLSDKAVRDALDILPRVKLEIEGDDMTYYVNRASDSYPLGEIRIKEWKPITE